MVLSDKKSYLDEADDGARQGDPAEARLRAGLEPPGRVSLKRGQESRPRSRPQERARKLEPKNGAFAADLCRALIEKKRAPVGPWRSAAPRWTLDAQEPARRTTSW